MKLTPALTVYLDLVRVVAALAVMASHYLIAMPLWFDEKVFGHDAVVVFFVLSGFVIAYVCDRRDRDVADYAINRLVRLWSVVIPALALGLGLQIFVGDIGQPSYPAAPMGSWGFAIAGTIANFLFLGETWAGTFAAPYNAPFWSLNYEAWYYACYGAYVLVPGRRGLIIAVVLCVLAGPKVMTLAPCWLAGVALYHWRDRLVAGQTAAIALFMGSLLAYAAINGVELTRISRLWLKMLTAGQSYHLGSSQGLIGDYALTAVVAAHFVAAGNLSWLGRVILPLRRPITWLASYTLSIYLFHTPLLVIALRALGQRTITGVWDSLALVVIAFAAILLLGSMTEHQRYRLRAMIGPRRESQHDRLLAAAPDASKQTIA